MRVWTGKCRMPIGACSEFRDKECPKFCYYNTIEVNEKEDNECQQKKLMNCKKDCLQNS